MNIRSARCVDLFPARHRA